MCISSKFLSSMLAALCLTSITAAESIIVVGSDTIGARLAVRLTESFRAQQTAKGETVSFELASKGTSTALASLMEGTTDIGMATRAPSAKETAQAKAMGVDFRTITVGYDSIAIIVNAANPIQSLSLEELELIYAGDVTDWASLSTALAGSISAYTRNTSSGTYSILQQKAMQSRDYGGNTLKLAGNEQIVEEVASNPHAIGYVGMAFAQSKGIKVLAIDHTLPRSPNYPLNRQLRFIIDGNRIPKQTVNDFIGFTLSPEGQAIVQAVNFSPIY